MNVLGTINSSAFLPPFLPGNKEKSLSETVSQSNLNKFEMFLKRNNHLINEQNVEGLTLLHFAAVTNNIEFVSELIGEIKNEELVNDGSRSPFLKEEFEKLTNAPIDINQQNLVGDTPLAIAIKNNYTQLALLLLNAPKVDVNIDDFMGNTPLMMAVQKRNLVLIGALLSNPFIKSNIYNQKGQTPLNFAIINNDWVIVKILLQVDGIDINFIDRQGHSPLLNLIFNENNAMTLSFLERDNICVNHAGKFGETALLAAIFYKQIEVVEKLLNYPKIDINHLDCGGNNALFIAVKEESPLLVRMILEKFPYVNTFTMKTNGITPLIYAYNCGSMEIVGLLREKKLQRFGYDNRKKLLELIKFNNFAILQKVLCYKIPHRHILDAIKLALAKKKFRCLKLLIAYNTENKIIRQDKALSDLNVSPSRYPLLDNMIRVSINRTVSGKKEIVLITQPLYDYGNLFDLHLSESYELLGSFNRDFIITPHTVRSINRVLNTYPNKVTCIIKRAHGNEDYVGYDEGFNIQTIKKIHFHKARKDAQIALFSCETGKIAKQISIYTGLEVFSPKGSPDIVKISVGRKQRIGKVFYYFNGNKIETERHYTKSFMEKK